jgi:hypothetical protein
VLRRAWSLRLLEAAALAGIVLNVVPSVSEYMQWWLTFVLLGGGISAGSAMRSFAFRRCRHDQGDCELLGSNELAAWAVIALLFVAAFGGTYAYAHHRG